MIGDDLLKEMDLSFYYMSWLVERFARSWGQRVRRLKEKIEEERPDEVNHIHNEVKDQASRIRMKEEEPDEATIKVHGVRIRKKIVHGKSEEFNGADLYLVAEDQKFALVQFKLQSNGRFQFDLQQLDRLRIWCDQCVQDVDRPVQCPAFVWLIDDSQQYNRHRIQKLCQLQSVLRGRSSASIEEFSDSGITRGAFKELLARCWVGAPFRKKPSLQQLIDYSEATRRLVVSFSIARID